jgi:hypothetical protein
MVSFTGDRSFILHLNGESDAALGHFIGRVEHVDSGRKARIGSREEFWKFIERVLRDQREESPGDDTG